MHILVPCNSLEKGKSRLSASLQRSARRELCSVLLHRTVQCAAAVAGSSRVWVVTPDPAAMDIAAGYAVHATRDRGIGLNAAVRQARAALLDACAEAMLVLPIDLPLASPAAIASFAEGDSEVAIAPNTDETGTNMLLLRANALRHFRFSYGPGSFAQHVKAAQELGVTPKVARDRRLMFDVDEPAQLREWLAGASAGHAHAFWATW